MIGVEDIRWFKDQFQGDIEAALVGTPFDVDMIVAIACQETGFIWSTLRKKNMPTARILALCVGDTLDADKGRKAFPRTREELLAKPHGEPMFGIARKALLEMAEHIPGYAGVARIKKKFCHGFGLFQYDLQFFLTDPDYFLERRYEIFAETLGKCLNELGNGLRKLGFQAKPSLTDFEFACVAIAYNTGGFKPSKGLKQGHFNGSRFYGEQVFDYLLLSRTVPGSDRPATVTAPSHHAAIIPAPTPVQPGGATHIVDTRTSPLRLRSEPKVSVPAGKNVIAHLPDGHPVRAITGQAVDGFLEVETSLRGAHLRGFTSNDFMVPAPQSMPIPVDVPDDSPPAAGIRAVIMPRRRGTVTRRVDFAGAHSLNEAGQPGRNGTTPAELVADLETIVGWLAVDKPAHKRYQPRSGLTFCNIYAHDYCHLAGVYLPRVWWTQRAVSDLAQGKAVDPLIGDTISEMRANDLFRWLRDFGPDFGWRQTGTLTKLQQAANQGAVGLIVARRKHDGKSGHIVMVVPETGDHTARRNSAGEVVAPLQSQAGTRNFRFGRGTLNWWKGEQFAESAFWIHS